MLDYVTNHPSQGWFFINMPFKDKNKLKEYLLRNREKRRNSHKKWLANNREGSLKYQKEYQSRYRQENLEYFRISRKKRYHGDIQFKLASVLRSRISYLLKNSKSGSAVDDLGCSISELKFYLEGKFKDGMTWNNYGNWHIDHIIPLTFFDLTNREQFLQACNYKNLQPLWAIDNIKKGTKIDLKELKILSSR